MTADAEQAGSSVLATIDQFGDRMDLSADDREAAQAVVSGLRNAKDSNTNRVYSMGWAAFTAWADTHGYQSIPASPQAVALYLGRLSADGKAMATIEQVRAAISHFHAAAGVQKADNPARHPVVAEVVKGWRNRASSPKQAAALIHVVLARVRSVLDGAHGEPAHPEGPGCHPDGLALTGFGVASALPRVRGRGPLRCPLWPVDRHRSGCAGPRSGRTSPDCRAPIGGSDSGRHCSPAVSPLPVPQWEWADTGRPPGGSPARRVPWCSPVSSKRQYSGMPSAA